MSEMGALADTVQTLGGPAAAGAIVFVYLRLRDIAEECKATRIILARLLQTFGVTEEQARADIEAGTVPPATHRIQARTPPRPLPVREFRRAITRSDGDR